MAAAAAAPREPHKREYLEFFESDNCHARLDDMIKAGKTRLVANVNELRTLRPERAQMLLEQPLDEIHSLLGALRDSVSKLNTAYGKEHRDKIFFGLEGNFGAHHVSPRGLAAHLLGKMVCVEGIVSRCTLVNPKLVRSVHYCPATEQSMTRDYRDATSLDGEPTSSTYPKADDAGNELVTEFGLSVYKNHQTISVQEMPERAPTGQLPRSVTVILEDDLVDACKPGDRVQLVGVYRAMAGKSAGMAYEKFNTVILANTVKLLTKEAMMPPLSDNDVKHIMRIAKSKKESPFALLSRSLAPSIYGHEHVKEGILCLLLSGVEHNLNRGGHIRGDVNILMVGDPSCGKSQLLRFVRNIAPHCINTTGRGASGVGLTAAVTTDQETGERRLDAGAMVLGDGGIVCVDEFDKMSDLDRVSLHEVMEQQTVTIAKAGIHTSLNARCSVLAAANPVYGQYDPYQGPMANIGLPDSLLSRFDLLFIVLDKMDARVDADLSAHVLQSHMYRRPGEPDGAAVRAEPGHTVIIPESERQDLAETPVYANTSAPDGSRLLNIDFMRKYIMMAKTRCRPVLTNEAAEEIATAYAKLRTGESSSKTLPVTARTLETMIRLATAHAKCRFSNDVEQEDAKAAIDLIRYSYFNEAKPRDRMRAPGKRARRNDDDGDSDSDGGDDGDDGEGSGGDDEAADMEAVARTAGIGRVGVPRAAREAARAAAAKKSSASKQTPADDDDEEEGDGKAADSPASDDVEVQEEVPSGSGGKAVTQATTVSVRSQQSAGSVRKGRATPQGTVADSPAKRTRSEAAAAAARAAAAEPVTVTPAMRARFQGWIRMLGKDNLLTRSNLLKKAEAESTYGKAAMDAVLAQMAAEDLIMLTDDDQIFIC